MTIAQIIAWIKNYKINTHAIATVVLALPVLYQENAQFHAYCVQLFGHVPPSVRGFIVALAPIWMLYRNSIRTETPKP